ncbi:MULTISPECIES: hypothetical protein [unclassified Nocardioides]|jgi:hypothetical protein|nr:MULTISPECIES: hypothetical protein [unclassified Nocardioides]
MTWQTITVAVDDLARVLARLRGSGATITHCTRRGHTCEVTYCGYLDAA